MVQLGIMADDRRILGFYFDVISPFAYLGWTQIHALADRHDVGIELNPILFASLLNTYENKGPVEIPPKREYTFKYASRIAFDLNVPMRLPPAHPFNPLLALRLAGLPLEPQARRLLIDRLFEMAWVTGEGVTDKEAVGAALDALGMPGADLVAQAQTPEAKARIKQNTEAAIAAGVFGVPTVIVDGELFWGQDSFPHLERYLRGKDPVDPELLEQWRALPATARRN